MQQIVTKFGGTSVSSLENWQHILTITKKHIEDGIQPIIVCSAYSGTSNQLEKVIERALSNEHQILQQAISDDYLRLAEALKVDFTIIAADLQQLQQWLTGIALLKEAPAKTQAQVLSLGELMMTRLGQAFLNAQGVSCHWFDAREALISTPIHNGGAVNYLAARAQSTKNPKLAAQLAQSGANAVITQGFIAANPNGETVLLGRGGSDTSAALLSAILQATACEIWTDVPGIYTANPHQLPHARLLKQLNYEEAQEIASMGAKVLHPPSIPPVRQAGIPMVVKYTKMPAHSGTRIFKESDENAPPIKSILVKSNITLISIDTLNMWQQVGFLADVFTAFKSHGFSVDLLSSSEFNVTLSLDSNAKLKDRTALDALITDLNQFGRAKIIEPCSAVSLVGHRIRTILPKLGPILEVFESQQVYLMSLPSNDLNLTFVVDAQQADKICKTLHTLLIENNPQSFYYSKSFQEEFGTPDTRLTPWWEKDRNRLLNIAKDASPCYVYDIKTQDAKANQLLNMQSIDQLFYAIKANPHPMILKNLRQKNINFECVSINELEHVFGLFPDIDKKRVLFTPNFAAKQEYEYALNQGYHVTIDSLYPIEHWPEIFHGKSIFVRIDPGHGMGHHKYVCTAGDESKFGVPQHSLAHLKELTSRHDIHVVGLHAHSGSGILTPELWQQTAMMLIQEAAHFNEVTCINLGGGLGIVDQMNQKPLDLASLDDALLTIKSQAPHLSFWLEPGRFFVAESGVILAKVTQSKTKGKVHFVGIETGMNSLLRPALYSAYHEIVNLSRLHEEKTGFAHVVGPICESADTIGYHRLLPTSLENDVILIANTGAYGHCMSSSYNLRPAACEIILQGE